MRRMLSRLLLAALCATVVNSSPYMPFSHRAWKEKNATGALNGEPESEERRLKRALLYDYDRTSRPVLQESDTVQLDVALSLFHLLDTDERQQTVRAVYSFRFVWEDEYLKWNSSGMERMYIPVEYIWHPDVFILNTAEDNLKPYMSTNAIVTNNGSVLWMVPHAATTTCSIDARFYPFDEQECSVIFVCWTYPGSKVNLSYKSNESATVYYSSINQEWDIELIEVERHNREYACCPYDTYPDVTFTLHMARRGLFYVVNLVLPSFLLYILVLIGFFLPDSEKVNMQTTILLTLVILLMMLSDMMPPTSDRIPIISWFFIGILLLVTIAIIMSVASSHISNRRHCTSVPAWGRRLIYTMNCGNMPTGRLSVPTCAAAAEAEALRGENANGSPSIYHEKVLEDWQTFSAALDKFFFYLFLALSVILMAAFISLLSPAFSTSHKE